MASERFGVEAMACGCHVYKYVWEAAVGKELRVCVADIVDDDTSLASALVAPWGSVSF